MNTRRAFFAKLAAFVGATPVVAKAAPEQQALNLLNTAPASIVAWVRQTPNLVHRQSAIGACREYQADYNRFQMDIMDSIGMAPIEVGGFVRRAKQRYRRISTKFDPARLPL